MMIDQTQFLTRHPFSRSGLSATPMVFSNSDDADSKNVLRDRVAPSIALNSHPPGFAAVPKDGMLHVV